MEVRTEKRIKERTKQITFASVFAAVYVIATAFNPLGYGFIQFRVSEIMLILPFWDRKFIMPSIVGVAVANMFSPLGFIDVFVGVLIAVISYTLIIKFKSKIVNCLLYSLLCGVMVGIELNIVYDLPILFNIFSITLSQIVVCGFGVVINNKLKRMKIIGK